MRRTRFARNSTAPRCRFRKRTAAGQIVRSAGRPRIRPCSEPGDLRRTLAIVNIRVARVCLDCDEVHDAQTCPICASESFAYVSRWVPVPERRTPSRPPAKSEDAETYDRLVNPPPARSLASRVTKGAIGLVTITVAGWLWQRIAAPDKGPADSKPSSSTPPAK